MFGWGKPKCAFCDVEIDNINTFFHHIHSQYCSGCGNDKVRKDQSNYEKANKQDG